MKTKRGSCTRAAARIRLNIDLAKKPPQCLEYIVVHELIHLIKPAHNARFISLGTIACPTGAGTAIPSTAFPSGTKNGNIDARIRAPPTP